eukprot:TRINITY_DN355_c0_g2_i1.p1 TRINITY_DN355_c0_g2~~TRINITY_DN355_c0_g2_i1.p1  ORF type:complete len:130 (+),score=15.75 TRINITY_DN355_c0_g2_i1:57-446(+)
MKCFVILCILAFCAALAAGAACSTCGSAAYTDIASECSKSSSGWSQSCCQCIATHESTSNYHACNKNNDGSIDVGLWQVNSRNWATCNGGNPPCDVSSNLRCAEDVWRWGGHTWKLWATCSVCGCCGKA